jgi:hypothetical protein
MQKKTIYVDRNEYEGLEYSVDIKVQSPKRKM